MIADYEDKDGSDEFFMVLDTDTCDGCGDRVEACQWGVLEIGGDENDPVRKGLVMEMYVEHRRTLKYSCGQCKPVVDRPPLPCVGACLSDALSHSW